MIWRRLETAREDIKEAIRLPDIRGERCVHSFLETASCSACVDICPKQAWILDDEQLGIDVEACDGCGLCAAECTEGAIIHNHEPLTGWFKNVPVVACACEKQEGVSTADEGCLPCVNAFSLRNLLMLYRRGFRWFFLSTAPCDSCERGKESSLFDSVVRLNRSLEQRGLARIKLHQLELSEWRDLAEAVVPTHSAEQISRRSFLRRAISDVAETGMQAFNLLDADNDEFESLAVLLPGDNEEHTLFDVPEIDIDRCTACNACVRLCPHEAIAAEEIEQEQGAVTLQYSIYAEKCTGCGICQDVCENEAIDILKEVPQSQKAVQLSSARCKSCGTDFQSTRQTPSELCSICSTINHNSNLFQVLD